MEKYVPMDYPEIHPYEDRAVDTIVSILNSAKEKVGHRQTLSQLAVTLENCTVQQPKVCLTKLKPPLVHSAEKCIAETIEKVWKLTDIFMYVIKYIENNKDEGNQYYYFEAVFSQPTISYPIPQATASVFFRVEEQLIEPRESKIAPSVKYRIEGHNSDHDMRFVTLIPDWLLAVIKMKINLAKRIEKMRLF